MEPALWHRFDEQVGRFGMIKRIENRVDLGTPDCCYSLSRHQHSPAVAGWVELKQLAAWPKRKATPVRIPHLTREQVLWLEGWNNSGGLAFVLLQVQRDYLLLMPRTARLVFECRLNKEQLIVDAVARGFGMFPTAEIITCLTTI